MAATSRFNTTRFEGEGWVNDTVDRPTALRIIASISPDTRAPTFTGSDFDHFNPLKDVQTWLGVDKRVDGAIARRFPALLNERQQGIQDVRDAVELGELIADERGASLDVPAILDDAGESLTSDTRTRESVLDDVRAYVSVSETSGEGERFSREDVRALLDAALGREGLPTFEEADAVPTPRWVNEPAAQPGADAAQASAHALHVTPGNAAAAWVQASATARTLLDNAHPTALDRWVSERDERLQEFADGDRADADAGELRALYFAAVAREAVPHGEPPLPFEETTEKLRDAGLAIPDVTPEQLAATSGIAGLDASDIAQKMHAPESEQTLSDIAAARVAVRRAMAGIETDATSAKSHLQTANRELTAAVEAARSGAMPDVTRAQESVLQASQNVNAIEQNVGEATTAQDTVEAAEVTLYTKDQCPGCFATKRALDKAGVKYEEIDLEQNPQLAKQFRQQGLMQAPVVEHGGDKWAGFKPSKLREHGLDHRSRQQRGGPDASAGRER